MSKIIEIPFQNLGINTEVDDDQNPGWTRQERANFKNGRVEKIRGMGQKEESSVNISPDRVKFWKYRDREYWLIIDESQGLIYRFDKDLSNPLLLYTYANPSEAINTDIEGARAVIYTLGLAPLTAVSIEERSLYHGIVGSPNYPAFDDTYLDWNRVRVRDEVVSPSSGRKLFAVRSSIGDNGFDRASFIFENTSITEYSRPIWQYQAFAYARNVYNVSYGNYHEYLMLDPLASDTRPERNTLKGFADQTTANLQVSDTTNYFYRYSLVFDGQQESELSESWLDTQGLNMYETEENGDIVYTERNVFKGKFTIDIGNSYVDGSFYPGNPRVTGINIYRSTDSNGLNPTFKKIITASTLGASEDLISRSTESGVSQNFLYDQCDFTQLGVTTDDYVYQGGQGNISEVEPDGPSGEKQEGLLRLSANTLGGGYGTHPNMVSSPNDHESDYVIVNRDLRTQLGVNGTYWCAKHDGLNDASGASTWRKGTAGDAPTLNTITAIAGYDNYFFIGFNNNETGWFGRNLHNNVECNHTASAFGFNVASFNGTNPGTLTIGTEYYWEAYIQTPETDGVNTILASYTGGSIPLHSGFSWHADSQLLAQVSGKANGGYGAKPTKISGYYTPTSANFYLMFFATDKDWETHESSPSWIDSGNMAYSSWSNSHFGNNAGIDYYANPKIHEFMICKASDVKRKGTPGCSLGWYSEDFQNVGDDFFRNWEYTEYDPSRGYPTTEDKSGWIAGSYGKCVVPFTRKDIGYDGSGDFGTGIANVAQLATYPDTTSTAWQANRADAQNLLNTIHHFTYKGATLTDSGCMTLAPNYSWKYNTAESGGQDTLTNNIMVDFEFIDSGIDDGAEHPGTITLSTDVRYKYQTSHIGRRFVGNVIINGDTDDPETHEDFILFSELSNPDVIPLSNFIKLNDLDGGEITGLAKSLGDIVALMERGVFILSVPSSDITQWTLTETYKDVGCTSPNSVCEYNNGVFFGNEDAFYYLDSGRRLITLTDSWSDDYQKYFRKGVEAGQDGIKQVMVIPNKNELVLIIGKIGGNTSDEHKVYNLDLNGFEEQPRWSKGIQSYPSAYVVDNLKQVYSFEDKGTHFSRYLVLNALDTEKADEYDNIKIYDLYLETPFQKLTDLDRNVVIRKLNIRYNSTEPIYIDFYTDGDSANIKKTITIPGSAVDITFGVDFNNYDDSKDFTHEANIKLRANRVKMVIRTGETPKDQASIRRLELEID